MKKYNKQLLLIEKIVVSSLGDGENSLEEISRKTKLDIVLLKNILFNLSELDLIKVKRHEKYFDPNVENIFVNMLNDFYRKN